MRYVGIALISILAGIGGGLLTYGMTQPSYDETAKVIASAVNPNASFSLASERRMAEERSALMGVGVGFLACAATAVAVTFLKTVVEFNVRNRPGG
ncbi:MAG: hypothetical protein WD875_17675 [Pirellulales bacterium]